MIPTLETDASLATIAYAYNVLGWDLVETHMNYNNVAARRLVDRLGGTMIAREEFPDSITRELYMLTRSD